MSKSIFILSFSFLLLNIKAQDPWDDVKEWNVNKNDAIGPDPWDTSEKHVKREIIKPNNVHHSESPTPPISDSFYKKNLKLIITRGGFKERGDSIFEGSLKFEFTPEEYNLLNQYMLSKNPFTAAEYRTIDGILSDCTYKPSIVQQNVENISALLLRLTTEHYIKIVVLLAFMLFCYIVYNTDWKNLSIMKLLVLIFIIIAYIWETITAIKEADSKDYSDYVKQRSCTGSSWMFWKNDCASDLAIHVSHFWTHLHPVRITGNLFTKLIAQNVEITLASLQGIIRTISGNFGIFSPIANTILNVGLFGFILVFMLFLVCHLVFNTPISFKYLFLSLKLNQREKVDNTNTTPQKTASVASSSGNQPGGATTFNIINYYGDNIKNVNQKRLTHEFSRTKSIPYERNITKHNKSDVKKVNQMSSNQNSSSKNIIKGLQRSWSLPRKLSEL